MLDPDLVPFVVAVLVALAVGLIVWVFLYPVLSGENTTERRITDVANATQARSPGGPRGANQEEMANKRKQVQATLKELEDKQKSKDKLTIKRRLIRAGFDVPVSHFYIGSILLGIVVGVGLVILGMTKQIALLGAFAATLGLPRWILGFLGKRRQAKFTSSFADAIDVVVRGVKSGLPLNECLQIIARESPEPIRSEFAELVDQQRVGMPLSECFERMMDRMPIPDLNFFAIVVAIQQQAGGNLAEALGNLSSVLRSRKMLAAKVQAMSAEAKTSAYVLGAMPFIVIGMVYLTSPDYISLLWRDPIGHLMMLGGGFWMMCGIIVMRQMINFKY